MKLIQDEAPRYFEAMRLGPRLVVAGWPSAIAVAVAGVVVAASGRGGFADILGVSLAALGAVAIAGLVRCRVFEIVVGSRLLAIGTGPFRRRIPLGLITSSDTRPSGSWRRLYADAELVLTLSADEAQVIVPTSDPEGLADAIRAAAH